MVERIRYLCKQNKTSLTKLEQALGFGNGTIGKWSKGAAPNLARVQAIADYFNVPLSYLTTGETDEKKPATQEGSELSDAKRKLLEAVDDLTDEQCMKLLGIILEAKKIL